MPKKGPVCRRVALFGEDTPFVYASESCTRGQDRPPEAKPASPPAPPLPARSEGHEASESGLASAKSWPLTGSGLSRFSAQCRCFTLNHRGRRLSEKKSPCAALLGFRHHFLSYMMALERSHALVSANSQFRWGRVALALACCFNAASASSCVEDGYECNERHVRLFRVSGTILLSCLMSLERWLRPIVVHSRG